MSRSAVIENYRVTRARDRIRMTSCMGADPEILSVYDVAKVLRCSVDTVRRIPRTELPARRGGGNQLLYLRSDVLDFFRRRPLAGVAPDPDSPDLAEAESAEIVSLAPQRGRRIAGFDPSAVARELRSRAR